MLLTAKLLNVKKYT